MVSTVAPSCIGLWLEFLSPVDRVSVRTEESVIRPWKLSWHYLRIGHDRCLTSFRIRPAHLSCISTLYQTRIWICDVKIIKESLRFSIPWPIAGSEVCAGWIPIVCFMNFISLHWTSRTEDIRNHSLGLYQCCHVWRSKSQFTVCRADVH
jgi:hypothetical protein